MTGDVISDLMQVLSRSLTAEQAAALMAEVDQLISPAQRRDSVRRVIAAELDEAADLVEPDSGAVLDPGAGRAEVAHWLRARAAKIRPLSPPGVYATMSERRAASAVLTETAQWLEGGTSRNLSAPGEVDSERLRIVDELRSQAAQILRGEPRG